MPIITMIGEDAALERLASHDVNIYVNDSYPGIDRLYMEVSHVGRVIYTSEHNRYDDSDFFAVVWDTSTNAPREIEYGSTRSWTYPNHAVIDATDEIKAAYQRYTDALADAREAERSARITATPYVGKRVRVTGGRKIPIGTEGEIFWRGADKYDRSARYGGVPRVRVGIKTDEGDKVFTAEEQVTVL